MGLFTQSRRMRFCSHAEWFSFSRRGAEDAECCAEWLFSSHGDTEYHGEGIFLQATHGVLRVERLRILQKLQAAAKIITLRKTQRPLRLCVRIKLPLCENKIASV